MTIKKALVFAVLLLGFSVYVTRVEFPREEADKKEKSFLKGDAASSLSRIEISRSGTSFALRNRSPSPSGSPTGRDSWEIEGVPGSKAEGAAVGTLTDALAGLELGEPLPKEDTEGDPSVYGLATPAVTVKTESPVGTRELRVGAKEEFSGKRFASVGAPGLVYLVPESVFYSADKSREEFRDKTPFNFDLTDVKEVTLTSKGRKLVVAHEGHDWKVIEPVKAAADEDRLGEFFRDLRALSADKFVDPPESEAVASVLADPPVAVRLVTTSGTTEIVMAPAKEADPVTLVRSSDSPSVLRVAGDIVSKFELDPFEVRRKRFISFVPESVSSFTVTHGKDVSFTLDKKDSGWTVNGAPGDDAFVIEYLRRLSESEAVDFEPADAEAKKKAVPEEAPYLSFVLKMPGTERSVRFSDVKDVRGRKVHEAAVTGDDERPLVESAKVRRLVPRLETFVKATPAPPAATPTAAVRPAEG